MIKKKAKFIILTLILSVAALYYGEMWYRRLFYGDGGSGNAYYIFDAPPNKVLADVLSFKSTHKELWTPNDTTLFIDQNRGYEKDVYIKFYKNKKYYHTWIVVRTDSVIENQTTLVFGGISSTPEWKDAESVNYMPILSRRKTLREFQSLLLDNLTIKTSKNY